MTEPSRVATAPKPRGSRYPSTALALIGSLLGSLGIVVFIVLVVVRPDGMTRPGVDWRATAEAANDPALIAPDLPEGWTANYAELVEDGGVPVWRIGFLSPAQGFVAMSVALEPDEAWLAGQAGDDGLDPTRSTIDGLDWTVFDRRDVRDVGNRAVTMIAELGEPDGRAVVLYGTGTDEEFRTVAAAVANAVDE